MKVHKVGSIAAGLLILSKPQRLEAIGVLTSLEPVAKPKPGFDWSVCVEIDEGKKVQLNLPPVISITDPEDEPIFLGDSLLLVFFRNNLFVLEHAPRTAEEREEVILRVKKVIYDEEADLVSLRSAVANLEAAIAYQKSGPRREPISDDVKLVVWARDGGACLKCGSNQNLHFDHIIPVAKGGGNSETNIQILCQACNLRKSDKIAAT